VTPQAVNVFSAIYLSQVCYVSTAFVCFYACFMPVLGSRHFVAYLGGDKL